MVALLVAVLIAAALYAVAVAVVAALGRETDARALARLVPDCIVMARGLLRDPRVGTRHRVALALLVGYLALPFDLIPDFLPVLGYLDDAVLIALTLRWLVRSVGPELIGRHWRGTARGLEIVLRLAYRPGG